MYHLVTGLYAHYTQKPRYNVLLLGISASGKTAWLDRVRSKVTRTGSRSLSRFHPTVGQNVLDLKLSRATLHFWDLGGEASLRRLWGRYFDEADVLVWAMDSRDWAGLVADDDNGGSEDEYDDGDGDGDEQQLVREARRQESWEALATLRSHSQLTSLPLLIVFTRLDQLHPKRSARFQAEIKPVLEAKFAELAKTEERDLDEEMRQLDQSAQGKEHQRRIWSEWQVTFSSAKDGTGIDDFVEWLHKHARSV